jgi:DNA topoisomerase-1
MGRFGPVAQIGNSENGNKPRFASLAKNQLLETITLGEALDLFRLPRSLGSYDGEEMTVGIGKFGPYIRHKNKFYSLKKGTDDPYSVTIERAKEIINEKNEKEKKKVIRDYGEVQIMNGKYGPYLSKDKSNYRLPKGTDPEKLTREDCLDIILKSNKNKKSS